MFPTFTNQLHQLQRKLLDPILPIGYVSRSGNEFKVEHQLAKTDYNPTAISDGPVFSGGAGAMKSDASVSTPPRLDLRRPVHSQFLADDRSSR